MEKKKKIRKRDMETCVKHAFATMFLVSIIYRVTR